MTNELNNDIIVVNGSPKPSFPQSIEKQSGQVFAKAKMTSLTFRTLLDNILNGTIDKASAVLNGKIKKVKGEIYIAEAQKTVEAVNDDAMKSLVGNQAPVRTVAIEDKEEKNVSIKKNYNNAISLDSNIAVIDFEDWLLNRKKITFNSTGSFLRRLLIPKKLVQACVNYSNKFSSKSSAITQVLPKTSGNSLTVEESRDNNDNKNKIANWRTIFSNVELSNEIIPETNGIDFQMDKETEITTKENVKISPEELNARKLKAQIGDELKSIRRLQKNLGGNTQFNNGLIERENKILQMLSELINIPLNPKKQFDSESKDTTLFQKTIDSIVGYKEPLTDEQHKKEEEEMQRYYSDPNVQEMIYDLQLKNFLFSMNQEIAAEKISAAERKDNERRASMSEALDLLDSSDQEFLTDNKSLSDVEEQSEILFEQDGQRQILQEGASEQARMLFEQNRQRQILQEGASVQARMLFEQNRQRQRLQEGASEQARMLFEQNKERQRLQEGASVQAKMLFEQNRKRQRLQEGASEQARMLFEQNRQRQILQEGASEQAKMLFNQYNKKSYTITDINSRYGIIQQSSKPIRINSRQIQSIRDKRKSLQINDSLIVSLKEQLDQLGLGEEPNGPVLAKVA